MFCGVLFLGVSCCTNNGISNANTTNTKTEIMEDNFIYEILNHHKEDEVQLER